MAIQFATNAAYLTRAAAYLNRAGSWTRLLRIRNGATVAAYPKYRNYHSDGDSGAYLNPYVFLGSGSATDKVMLEAFDGIATYYQSAEFSLTASTWAWIAAVYDAGAHTLKFYADGALIDTLAVDLSTFVFVETTQRAGTGPGGNGEGDDAIAQILEWQRAIGICDLKTQAASATPIVHLADLLTATPLNAPTDLADRSGNARDWTKTGTPTGLLGPSYVIPVGSIAFSGFGDAAMKFHTPDGIDLGAPAYAPRVGISPGHGCGGIASLDSFIVGVTDAGYPFPLDYNAAALDSQLHPAPLGGQVAPVGGGFRSIASNYADHFYGIQTPDATNAIVAKFDGTGAQVGSWSLGAVLFPSLTVLGLAPDESVAYFAIVTASAVSRRDLVAGTTTTFATEAGYRLRGNSILVLRNGDVLIGWDKIAAGAGYVKHYSAAGALLYTYALAGAGNTAPLVLTPGLTDQTFVVQYSTTSAATSSGVRVATIETGSGTVVDFFDPDDGLGFQYDGPCCVLRDQVLLSIECPATTAGNVGTPFSVFLEAAGGTEPYTYSIASGTLPAGLTLDAATGEISGTPTTAAAYTFTVQVEDDDGTIAVSVCACSITITGAIVPFTITLPTVPGAVGSSYTLTPTVTGGTAPLVFTNCGGTHVGGEGCLPPGLTLDPATGIISGTPTLAGSWTIYVCVTDATGTHLQAAAVITIVALGVPMTGFLSPDARLRMISDLSTTIPGAKLHTYQAGTPATPLTTYSDDALTVPNANPVVASAGGLFGPIYLTPGQAYKFYLTDADDVAIWTQDNVAIPINALAAGVGISLATVDGVTTISAAPRATSVVSSATPTPDVDTTDLYSLTALTTAAAFVNPTGTPTNGQRLTIRIKDDATARALTWGTAYVAGGVALPATTVLSKITTLSFIWNSDNALNKWQLIASAQEA